MKQCILCGKNQGVICKSCLAAVKQGGLPIKCLACAAYNFLEDSNSEFPVIPFPDKPRKAVCGMLFVPDCPNCAKKLKLVNDFTREAKWKS